MSSWRHVCTGMQSRSEGNGAVSDDSTRPKVACIKFVFLPASEVFIAEQLHRLNRYEPLVLAVSAPNLMGIAPERVHALSRLDPVTYSLNRLALKATHTCPHFESVVRRERAALLHAQFGVEGLCGLRLKRRTGLPLLTSFHGYDAYRLPRRRLGIYRELFAEGDLFLACSQSMRKQLLKLGCPDEKIRVLPLGVDTSTITFRERQSPGDGPVHILLVGRLVEKKGIPYALQAFAAVRRYHRNATLTIIGDGPERPTIEALLRKLNLTDVRLLGAQSNEVVLREMQRAHLYLQPSVTALDGDAECTPVTLMEAQASGLPVVATWHAGISELVVDGKSGFLVSERNPHALAERLRYLIEHPGLWGPLGRAGRAVVEERFSRPRQVTALEEVYDEALAGVQ